MLFIGTCAMGCADSAEKPSRDAYIGGQIINPTSKYVIFLKDNLEIDTVYLDQKNRFQLKIRDVEQGLYSFKHLPETQFFYLLPGDSLLMRVNSIEFDESLHFSGTGSERNNYLLESFLLNESYTNLLLSYHESSPEAFAKKTDSLENKQLARLKELDKKHNFSKEFMSYAQKSASYDAMDLRERYTYLINKYYKKFSDQLTDEFYCYRKDIDFNDPILQTSPSYLRFVDSYLINKAMDTCAKANLDHDDCYDLYDHGNITTRIKLLDSLTTLPLVKQHFFRKLGALGIVMAKNREEIVSILDLVEEKGYPENELQKLYSVGNIQLAYLPGMNVSQVELADISGNKKPFKDITGSKPVVVFLWSIFSTDNHRKNHKIIRDLRSKYPEVQFIGINIDAQNNFNWKRTVRKFGYDQENEFQLITTRIGPDAFQYYLNKSLFIDPKAEVVIGNAYINSPQFESEILEFLNR